MSAPPVGKADATAWSEPGPVFAAQQSFADAMFVWHLFRVVVDLRARAERHDAERMIDETRGVVERKDAGVMPLAASTSSYRVSLDARDHLLRLAIRVCSDCGNRRGR